MGNILIRFWKYKTNNTYETVTNTKNKGYPGKDNPLNHTGIQIPRTSYKSIQQ